MWSKLDKISCPKSRETDWRKSIEQVIKERIMEMVGSVWVKLRSKITANVESIFINSFICI